MKSKIDISKLKDEDLKKMNVINIAKEGYGHQMLICETEKPEDVENVVKFVKKKLDKGCMAYTKLTQESESVMVQNNEDSVRNFVIDQQYAEKVIMQAQFGG